eukprot:scaffold100842_cov72-Phaeocystis_antarctica.AAC.5
MLRPNWYTPVSEADAAASGGGAAALAGLAAAAAGAVADASPTPTSISMKSVPTITVSSMLANSLVIVPAAGARNSTVTLSVSIDATISSSATWSPTFFPNSRIVPSVIESPISGTGKVCTASARRQSAGVSRLSGLSSGSLIMIDQNFQPRGVSQRTTARHSGNGAAAEVALARCQLVHPRAERRDVAETEPSESMMATLKFAVDFGGC